MRSAPPSSAWNWNYYNYPHGVVAHTHKEGMDDEGNNRCLNAFIVALDQACEWQGRRWYASTLELQLASLEMCRACRRTPTLHVHVDDQTPGSLWWSPRKPRDQPNSSGSTVSTSCRVPPVRALRLTWGIPLDALQQNAKIDLWTWLECLRVRGSSYSFGASLESIVWPQGLTRLELDTDLETAVEAISWPASLQRLSFGGRFNQPIAGALWPPVLEHLSLGGEFDQPIVGVVWPSSLQHLSLGNRFDQRIAGVQWPSSLQTLSVGDWFDQPIVGVVWPASLQQLSFGFEFDRPISGVTWPASLQRLFFGRDFNQPIDGVVWPSSLQQLKFGYEFNQPIAGVVWPPSLQHLEFGRYQRIDGIVFPASLKSLHRGGNHQNIILI